MRWPGTSIRVGALHDWPEFIITEATPPVTARYVRVHKTASEYFFLGEVQVHGKI